MGEAVTDEYRRLGISSQVFDFGETLLRSLEGRFREIDQTAEYNQLKVLAAFQENMIGESHLSGTTGYGYHDSGRDALERVYADIFHTEAALVRPQIACGTHALSLALFSNLRPGDELLSPVGKPYDTLEQVIGIRPAAGSLAEYGITYREVALLPDGSIDYPAIEKAITPRTKLVTIQRSRGYQNRPTLSIDSIGQLIAFVKNINPKFICMVDNCYGEFVDTVEPSDVGADLCVGSLIKNPGGGLAPMGGYLAGKEELIEQAGYRLVSPGLGRAVGASLEVLRSLYQGIFFAPTVTAAALKGAVFAAKVYQSLGFNVNPKPDDDYHDIIQAITFENPMLLTTFCQAIQAASPIDGHVLPEAAPMPGYSCPVIMASGSFISGSSIELSADGPLREPYIAYLQGGLTFPHAKAGVLKSLQSLLDAGLVELPSPIYT
ncbi:MAG: methionine gamma-lyase family protein [Lachnospiraceae bacterium]|nr:methionine gamma-lyase family protein [Lachnospiraceae bacterium]